MTLVVEILNDPDGQTPLARVLSQLPSNRAGYQPIEAPRPHCSPGMNAAPGKSSHLRHGTVGPPSLFPQPRPTKV